METTGVMPNFTEYNICFLRLLAYYYPYSNSMINITDVESAKKKIDFRRRKIEMGFDAINLFLSKKKLIKKLQERWSSFQKILIKKKDKIEFKTEKDICCAICLEPMCEMTWDVLRSTWTPRLVKKLKDGRNVSNYVIGDTTGYAGRLECAMARRDPYMKFRKWTFHHLNPILKEYPLTRYPITAYPVTTNCGHMFCGSCWEKLPCKLTLYGYHRHDFEMLSMNGTSCPLCRSEIIDCLGLPYRSHVIDDKITRPATLEDFL
jgi:hypothetical protein